MTATVPRHEYDRMRRIAKFEHGKRMAALVEIDQLRKDLLTAHLMVAKDAFDSPGRMTSAIRPFLAGAVERHGIDPDQYGRKDPA